MRRLTFEEIRGITIGAISIEQKEDGIHFHKCTKKQEKAWGEIEEILGYRARTTTGVRFDFITDSKTLKLDTADGIKYELLIDGQFIQQVFADEYRARKQAIVFDLGAGEKRVTLLLPSHTVGVVKYVEIDDGAKLERRSFKTKMLFIGDSITQGYDSTCDSLSYAYRTSFYFDAESVIQGVGGGTYQISTYDEFDFEPDVVLVAYGANDWNWHKDIASVIENMDAYLSRLKARYKDKRLVVITLPWNTARWAVTPMGTYDELVSAMKETAGKNGFEVIEGEKMIPPSKMFFIADGLHPNALGFSLYAQNLTKALKKD